MGQETQSQPRRDGAVMDEKNVNQQVSRLVNSVFEFNEALIDLTRTMKGLGQALDLVECSERVKDQPPKWG